ncbi:DUF2288 family protein [Pleurocapsales cyanobacterium LEGE 06147]|nr:DUF2288 family protein [Pleurocapsales cyanobacterium LEGE 06147]
MPDIKAQLSEQLASVEWNLLIPHAQREAVIVVNEQLDLLDVAVAIAEDDSASVQAWIDRQLIHKPSFQNLSIWNNQPNKQFMTLIVQPFVIVQEK